MEYRNAVFVVTEEHACPIYNVGDQFVVHGSTLTIERNKEVCLILVQEVLRALTGERSLRSHFTQPGMQRTKFECGGCTGLIRFEYKKESAYSTLQMNLLEVSKKRAKKQLIEEFFGVLREMELFEPLDDFDLQDLALLMKLQKYSANKVIIEAGELGTHFYVVLAGTVAVVKKEDNEVVAEIGPGDIFGEMSLLSGELTYPSVYSKTAVQLAALKAKDFKHVLSRYPILQIFFYRVLVSRAQENTIRSGNISSGMSGELADINSVELFQLINSGGKTGRVQFTFDACKAVTLFNEGEIVYCQYDELEGKEAIFSLLAKQKGSFIYSKGLSAEEKRLPVLGGFMGLVMEGLRRIDEEQGEGE
jgi:CRP-like cAMP-binding protein